MFVLLTRGALSVVVRLVLSLLIACTRCRGYVQDGACAPGGVKRLRFTEKLLLLTPNASVARKYFLLRHAWVDSGYMWHSFHFISFHFISFHFISFHFISFHFISFHFISFHFISFHFISFHFISFHFISFHFISFMSHTQHARNVHAQCDAKPCTHGWTAVCFKTCVSTLCPCLLSHSCASSSFPLLLTSLFTVVVCFFFSFAVGGT